MPPRPAPSAERKTTPRFRTLADVITRLGVPPEHICLTPQPGTATEADVEQNPDVICELFDGTLVEKAVGAAESFLGGRLNRRIGNLVESEGLGVVLPGDGHIRLGPGLVRAPDVTFIPWESFPDGEFPDEAYWTVAPGLVVEVLSPTNTAKEIDRKLRELFAAGCKLAWVIDPPTRTAKVYTSAKRYKELDETGTLDGGKVLPGFALPLAELFARPGKPKRKGR